MSDRTKRHVTSRHVTPRSRLLSIAVTLAETHGSCEPALTGTHGASRYYRDYIWLPFSCRYKPFSFEHWQTYDCPALLTGIV